MRNVGSLTEDYSFVFSRAEQVLACRLGTGLKGGVKKIVTRIRLVGEKERQVEKMVSGKIDLNLAMCFCLC